jgi:hypothetical protein
MVVRLSQGSLLYVNLALGLFVAIANGAALALVLTGRAENLIGQGPEIAAWSIAGLLLAITAAYALRRSETTAAILQFQTYLVIALVVALAAWALMLVIDATSSSARVVWAVGYLSILALYCWILGSHAFPGPEYARYRQLLAWVLLPCSIAIDILTYIKVTD